MSRAMEMPVRVERGRKRELTIVVENYVSLLKTHGWPIPASKGVADKAPKGRNTPNHGAANPPVMPGPPRSPLSAAPLEPQHHGSHA